MKNLVLVSCSLAFASGIAAAQGCAPTKVAILQAEAALESTKEGQAALAELDKRLGPRKADLEKQKKEIDDLQDKLNRQSATAAQSVKDDLQNSITAKTKTFNRNVQDYQDDVQAEENKVLADLTTKMRTVIEKYGRDNCLALIWNVSDPNTPVLYFADAVDITKAIIEAYDKAEPAASTAKPLISPAKPPAARPAAAKPPAAVPPPAPAPAKKP